MTSREIRSSVSKPPEQGVPAPHFNEQMHILQSLMEIQKDLAKLTGTVERLEKDVQKSCDKVDDLGTKISRFEGYFKAAAFGLVVVGAVAWWVFGDKFVELRNQMFQYQQKVEAIAAPK